MAELATIARPYAEAIFQAAQGASLPLSDVAATLNALARIGADPQVRILAGDPQFSADRLGDLLLSALPQQPAEAVRRLLQVMLENHRLAALPEVADQFQRRKDLAENCVEAVIRSAFPLDPTQLEALLPALERKFGRKLYASVEVDPTLIGGVSVAVGDEVFDTSVRARLDSMRVALTA